MSWPRDTASSLTHLGQLFAIRPDSYIQDERSFIIESDLMQDYANDAEAAKSDGSLGEGASRYHTHVTMVDANNAPRANQSVKLWADEDGTKVSLDGTAYTIGPNTPAFFSTDGTGSFTIITDATDLATTTLRVWSPFMDEHERIAIVPDAEFHTACRPPRPPARPTRNKSIWPAPRQGRPAAVHRQDAGPADGDGDDDQRAPLASAGTRPLHCGAKRRLRRLALTHSTAVI